MLVTPTLLSSRRLDRLHVRRPPPLGRTAAATAFTAHFAVDQPDENSDYRQADHPDYQLGAGFIQGSGTEGGLIVFLPFRSKSPLKIQFPGHLEYIIQPMTPTQSNTMPTALSMMLSKRYRRAPARSRFTMERDIGRGEGST